MSIDSTLVPLTRGDIPAVKALIAEVVLEFYGDLDFLPKTVPALLAHYETIGYRNLRGNWRGFGCEGIEGGRDSENPFSVRSWPGPEKSGIAK